MDGPMTICWEDKGCLGRQNSEYRNTVSIILEALTILDEVLPTHQDSWNLVVSFLRSSILFLNCLPP